jgi:uncharacterized protein (TIGR00297 family)
VSAGLDEMRVLADAGIGLLLSILIAVGAYRREALSLSGAGGAVITGTLIFTFGGWIWGGLLITFFVLSALLSKYRAQTKEQMAEKFAKGSRRDLGQVLANGGAGAFVAVVYSVAPHPMLFFAFAGAMAAVNADTWATELGVLSPRPPRMVTTGRRVEPGTSGGVSLRGTLATVLGGTAIGLAGVVFLVLQGTLGGPGLAYLGGMSMAVALIVACALGGLVGSLFDSLLGATLQAIYYSERRSKETERAVDPDGSPNRRVRGWAWLSNDWVNFFSSLMGAGVCAGIYPFALRIIGF